MARNAAVCSAAILLLAASVYAAGDTMGLLTAVEATDLTGVEEKNDLLSAHRDGDKEEAEDIKAGRRQGATAGDVASLASADEERKEIGSDWSKPKKLDEEDKKNDSDSDSDSDSGSDSDSDSDSGSDSDSDSDSDDDDEDHNSKHPAPRTGRKRSGR